MADRYCYVPMGGMSDVSSCRATCENLWNEAVDTSRHDSPYDLYTNIDGQITSDYGDCEHDDIQFGNDAIHAIGKFTRSYVIVDECISCSQPIGEQGFAFTCPFEAS